MDDSIYQNERLFIYSKAVCQILSRPQTVFKRQYETFTKYIDEYQKRHQEMQVLAQSADSEKSSTEAAES